MLCGKIKKYTKINESERKNIEFCYEPMKSGGSSVFQQTASIQQIIFISISISIKRRAKNQKHTCNILIRTCVCVYMYGVCVQLKIWIKRIQFGLCPSIENCCFFRLFPLYFVFTSFLKLLLSVSLDGDVNCWTRCQNKTWIDWMWIVKYKKS